MSHARSPRIAASADGVGAPPFREPSSIELDAFNFGHRHAFAWAAGGDQRIAEAYADFFMRHHWDQEDSTSHPRAWDSFWGSVEGAEWRQFHGANVK